MTSDVNDKLMAQLDENEKKLNEAKNKNEYLALRKEREKIIMDLFNSGYIVKDELDVLKTPIFNND